MNSIFNRPWEWWNRGSEKAALMTSTEVSRCLIYILSQWHLNRFLAKKAKSWIIVCFLKENIFGIIGSTVGMKINRTLWNRSLGERTVRLNSLKWTYWYFHSVSHLGAHTNIYNELMNIILPESVFIYCDSILK